MSFANRSERGQRLERVFISAFNASVTTHRIMKTGIEATEEAHSYHNAIRYCHDATTAYVRYSPDSIMFSFNPNQEDTTLVEFKYAETGVRKDSFFQNLQRKCPDIEPPFGSRHDIYNLEADAFDHYKRLAETGAKIIIVAYRSWHRDTPLRAQFVENIAVCDRYDPNQGQQNIGSGTHIVNTNFASFVSVPDFFTQHYRIERTKLEQIEQSVATEFNG